MKLLWPERLGSHVLPACIGITAGLAFWILHSLVDAFITHKGMLITGLFHPSLGDLGLRLLVILTAIAFTTMYARAVRAERRAREQQKELSFTQFAIDHSSEFVFWIDRYGHIAYANSAASRRLGYTPEELLTMSVPDINPSLPPGEWDRHWKTLKEREHLQFESLLRTKAGKLVPVEVAANYLNHNGDDYDCGFARDITDRKRTEAELARSRASLVRAQSIARIGNWERDLATNQAIWSDEMYVLMGLTPGEITLDYATFLGFVHPEDREDHKRAANDAIMSGKPYSAEFRMIRRDKTEIFVRSNAEAIRDEHGKPSRLIGTVQDVTEAKHAEQVLRDSESRVRLLLDSTAEGIFGMDLGGTCIFANHSCAKILGYAHPDDLVGAQIHRLIHHTKSDGSPYPDSECPSHKTIRTGEKTHAEDEPFWKKDGTSVRVEYWVEPILRDERIAGTVNTFIDITARKRAEEHQALLAEAGAILGSSLDYSKTLKGITRLTVSTLADCCGMFLIQDGGRASLVELATQDLAKEPILRQLVEDFPPDMDNWAQSPFAGMLHTQTSVLIPELTPESYKRIATNEEHLRLISAMCPTAWMIVPLLARKRLLGFISLTRFAGKHYDQTDLAAAEDLARRAAAAVDNTLLYKAANEAIQTRDDFMSIASHELKTPLTSLRLQLPLVRRLLRDLLSGVNVPIEMTSTKDKLSMMIDGSEKQITVLTSLINSLLDVTRIRAGKIELAPTDVDLGAEVKEVVTGLMPQISRSGSSISVDVVSTVIGAWDRNRIRQIITNLLSNAIKYGESKPVEIHISGEGGIGKLTVQDHGPGIPREQQDRIFNRFERAGSTRGISGLGLGLYITRQLVEAHKGTIRVESEPAKGARFIVELPLSPEEGPSKGHGVSAVT